MAPPPPDPPDPADQARAAVEAASRDPRNIPALLQAAEMCLRAGQAEAAVAHAFAAVEADGAGFRPLRTLSGMLAVVGRTDEALRYGRLAVEADPADGEARLHLGGLLMAVTRYREAAEHLARHVVSSAPRPVGWRLLSTALHQSGNTERAISAVEHAIAEAPNEVEYRIHRASLLASRGRYGDALDELLTASQQAPDDWRVPRTASFVHEAAGDLPSSLQAARRAASLAPSDAALTDHCDRLDRLLGLPSAAPATPDTTGWTEPRRRGPRRPLRPRPGALGQIAARWRVVDAVMLRDMRTRFSRSRLGYVWAIFEPISHLLTLGMVFSYLNTAPPPIGTNLFLFYCTGLLPYLMWSHISNEVTQSVSGNGAVLRLPSVRTTDVMAARSLLQFATEIVVAVVVFGIAASLGEQGMPADPLQAAAAFLSLGLLGIGTGAINLVLCRTMHCWDTLFQSVVRLLYFASGIYYSPIAMPAFVRDILVWNPILQGIEWFRAGFFRQYDPHWLDRGYVLCWVAATLVIGLAMERAARRRLMAAA
jgi:capsular polysaccharide transport system permease protein